MEKKLVFFIRNLRAFCIYFLRVFCPQIWKIKNLLRNQGHFQKLDGNVLEIALQLYSALSLERLKIIHLF